MALSPGALVIVALMPVVGALVTRLDPRWLIAFGFVVLAASMFHMAHTLYPGIDFSTAVWLRNYQAVGLAFLFVPINTVVYVGIPPAKNNAVSGIVNLSRNMGGDIGIALVTTLIARRSQFHQANLVAHLDPKRAYGVLSQQLAQQAQTLAYADVLYIFACFAALMAPLVFLTKRTAPGAQVVGH